MQQNKIFDMFNKLNKTDVEKLVNNNIFILNILKNQLPRNEYLQFKEYLKTILYFIPNPEKILLQNLKIQRPDIYQYFQQNKMAYSWLLNNIHFIKKNI